MQRTEIKHKLTNPQQIVSSFLSGASAGAVVAYTLFPFESFKKFSQLYNVSLSTTLTQPKQLLVKLHTHQYRPFHGSAMFALNIIPTTGLQLMSNAVFKAVIPEQKKTKWTNILTSAGCGVIGAITATPIENFVARLLKIQEEQQRKVSNTEVFFDLKRQGLRRFFKSYGLIATRDGIFTYGMLEGVPRVTALVDEKYHNKSYTFLAKVMACTLGAATSHPFDTVATQMQKNHFKQSALSVFKSTVASRGLFGLWRGLPARVCLFFAFSQLIPKAQQQVQPVTDRMVSGLVRRN